MKTRALAALPLLIATALFAHVARSAETVPPRAWAIAAVAALLVSLGRLAFRRAWGGFGVDLALTATAVVACGQRRVGAAYVVASVLAAAALIAVSRARDARSGWSVVETRSRAALAGVLVAVGGLAAAAMFALPALQQVTQRQFERFVLPSGPSHVGFAESLGVTSLDDLLGSDDVVLRVHGAHVDYLRGRVYDSFEWGRWESTHRAPPARVSTPDGERQGPGVTEVRAVGALRESDPRARFFVPLGARRVGTASGAALVDDLGTLQPPPGDAPTLVSFEVGAPDYPVAPPTDRDLGVPAGLRSVLEPIALDWTRDASDPAARLAAIERRLRQDFTYSLDRAPASREPPIVQFLRTSRRGHCELFATAMALLARTAGVPARVVGGFRVTEHNAIGDYDVVRERNAHAWVEAWVGSEGWRTFDPTPPTEANLRRDGRALSALIDAVLAWSERAVGRLGLTTLRRSAVVVAVAAALLLALRRLRARQRSRAAAAHLERAEAPLPCFARLERALARLGHPRPPSEPLERYALRLREATLDRAAQVVLDYTALRYGGVGEAAAVARQVEACEADLAERSVRGPA